MIDLTMWVLYRHGEVRRDNEGYLLFDTRSDAVRYWRCAVPFEEKGWRAKKVRVTDANKG